MFVLLAASLFARAQTVDKVFVATGHEPEFPGGIEKFYSTLLKNIHYPAAVDTSKNIYSKLIIQFIVEKDGSLSNIQVSTKGSAGISKRDSTDPLSKEVTRVLKTSPKWKPAIQNGHRVRFLFNIPVNVDFQGEE